MNIRVEWNPVNYYEWEESTYYLIYCKEYGVCEAIHQTGHGTWYICRESKCISTEEALYWCELPECPYAE